MLIQRELDKVFRVTITEKEAELICDCSVLNFSKSVCVVRRIGSSLLNYMQDASINPHTVKPPMKVELLLNGS